MILLKIKKSQSQILHLQNMDSMFSSCDFSAGYHNISASTFRLSKFFFPRYLSLSLLDNILVDNKLNFIILYFLDKTYFLICFHLNIYIIGYHWSNVGKLPIIINKGLYII